MPQHSPPPLRLFTSRYQFFRPEFGVPIGITVGRPRFVRYAFERVSALAPHELFKPPYKDIDDVVVERRVYRERLVTHEGLILEQLAEVAARYPGQIGVLLCFEDVLAGQACHRRWAAEWFAERFGWDIPEMVPAPPQPQPGHDQGVLPFDS